MALGKQIILTNYFRETIDYACTVHQLNVIKKKSNIFNHPIDDKAFFEILDKLEFDNELIVSPRELLFIFVLLDHTNNLLLENAPPYSEVEMKFFADSEQFFSHYNNKKNKDFKSKWIKYKDSKKSTDLEK